MTTEQNKLIRDGLDKIIACYESNYRGYINSLRTDNFATEKFKSRMKTVDKMIESWENLITHFTNLEYKSYKPTSELDRIEREIKVGNWMCILRSTLSKVSDHWYWLGSAKEALTNLLISYRAYYN